MGIYNILWTYNIKDTHANKDDSCMGILEGVLFEIFSTKNRLKVYTLGQLIFGCDIILLVKYKAYWLFMCHQNQEQTYK